MNGSSFFTNSEGSSGLGTFGYLVWNLDADGNRSGWEAPPGLSVTFNGDRLEFTAVPEPETWTLSLAGLLALGLSAGRRRRAANAASPPGIGQPSRESAGTNPAGPRNRPVTVRSQPTPKANSFQSCATKVGDCKFR